ncbi:oxidoreductase [Penicillium riverlandense]|uniref:oxidoreductase n=1 Tax=Penicillium riverlandense TaxID=1903569 RepID=UPI0025498CD6|nr:oxidoreductase [Penicillium riverlandense]KAJ5808173.1 oxidoreductase [Penicillium riverlandense]
MASPMGEHGTFKAPRSVQSQPKPGLEKDMRPPSESTKLESKGQFNEYVGSGKLKDKKVLLTGGDSGIGRSVAILMAREGADVSIVHLPKEQEDAEYTKSVIEKEGRSCHLIAGDLRDRAFCCQAVKRHVQNFGHINVLINNASEQNMCKNFVDIDLDEVEDIFRSNIIQMMALTKYALPHMFRGDSIINTSSVVTFRGSGSMVDYSATKGAVVGFTRSLAVQLIPKGIRVNAVAPGAVYTPIQVDTRDAKEMEGWGTKTALGRPGEPSEVATSFIFLASPESTLWYGQIMHCHPLGD